MSAVSKNARGYSRRPLSENSDVAQNTHHAPTAGSKRLFSNRESRLSSSSQDYGENHTLDHLPAEDIHSEKRRRPSDWPLSNTTPSNAPPPKSTPQRNRHASPPSHRPSSSQVRPSKFLEGSMNDRVSQKPPTPYLGDEQRLREQFLREENARGRKLAHPRKFMHHSNTSAAGSSAERSETSRHSSIFRFGKSLAASFNPSNWKIWSKQEQVEEETEQHQTLRERQEKAEKIYKELKRTGHFRDSNLPSTFPQLNGKHFTPMKHDSGVSFRPSSASATSREEKRMGRVFLEPPHLESHGGSPTSIVAESVARSDTTARKNSFGFRRSSFSNMRKDLGSDSGSIAPEFDDQHQVRRIPSRKDLQKQQKLVKRVSDLEGKLEAARRQLCEALGTPVPPKQHQPRTGRPRFVPGALSTLPSERLLSGYVDSEVDDKLSDKESFSQIGRAVTTNHEKDNDVAMHGARESYELEGDTLASPPARVNKPLPKAPQSSPDQTMDIVESEKAIEEDPTTRTNPSQSEVLDSDHESASSSSHATRTSSYQTEASPERETEAEISDASQSESEFDLTREPTKKPPTPNHQAATTPAKTKKRKSTFGRERDDSGTYKPPPKSESSIYSAPIKKMKTTPKKSSTAYAVARPRKLQKTVAVNPENPGFRSSPLKEKEAPTTPVGGKSGIKYRVTPKPNKTTSSQISRSGSRLSKATGKSASAISMSMGMEMEMGGGKRQSMSSPPSSSFTGLFYPKPTHGVHNQTSPGQMGSPGKGKGKEIGSTDMGNGGARGAEPMYSAIPSTEGEVPPMPKFPKKVRLPSGEVVSTGLAGSSLAYSSSQAPPAPSAFSQGMSGHGKLTKSRPVGAVEGSAKKGGGMKRDESFEWGDDVF